MSTAAALKGFSKLDCPYDVNLSKWVTAAVLEQFILCILGTLCNAVTIWCLSKCKRAGKAIKLQLIVISILQVCICTITLPVVTYLYYCQFFCMDDHIPTQMEFFFSILNSMLLQAERLNFTLLAVYRVLAICLPHKYKDMVTKKKVMISQGLIGVLIMPPWLGLGISKNFNFSNMSGSVMRLNFEKEGSYVKALYGINYCFPFVVTLGASIIMMIFIFRRNPQVKLRPSKKTSNSMDHVASTISIVIFANLCLDGPHVVVHLLERIELASIITHMAFFLHLVFDPMILVGMNAVYRKAVIDKICHCHGNTVKQPPGQSIDVADMSHTGEQITII